MSAMGPVDGAMWRERLAAQLLAGSHAATPVAVVERLLAVQAQDPRGFRLAVRSRSRTAAASEVDRALTDGALVVGWLNRGTLHLVRREDYWWLHGLTAPRQRAGNRRRLREEGVDELQAERGIRVIEEALAADGPLTRAALRARLDDAGVPTGGQAFAHVVVAAGIEGVAVRGPVVDGELGFVDPTAWIGSPPAPDRDAALAELARRYLAGHGPAEPADLAAWSGLPLRDAHRGFELLGDETEDRPSGCVALRGRTRRAGLPPPRLLGPFDPLLHGWRSREFVVGAHRDVVTVNGIFRPVALVDGRVVATWRLADGIVTVEPREPVPVDVLDALAVEGAAVLRYLGLPAQPVLVSERIGG
jgi:hypothetical protein